MADFKYRASNSMGEFAEGVVTAPDMPSAAEIIRLKGYMPTELSVLVAEPVANYPMTAVESGQSAQVASTHLLTLTVPEEQFAYTGLTLGGEIPEEAEEQNARLEPWQRGGAVPRVDPVTPPVTAMVPSSMGTAGALSSNSLAGVAPRVLREQSGQARTPETLSLAERFKEAFIYPVVSGIVLKDLVAYYRQFATLINAGMPMYQALIGLESQTKNGRLKEATRLAAMHVQRGGRLSEFMATQPTVFPRLHVEMVGAAEQGGMLDSVLRQIADDVEHELQIRRLLFIETFYPKAVLFMALMLLGGHFFVDGTPAFSKLILGGLGKQSYGVSDYLNDTIGFGLKLLIPIFLVVALFRLVLFRISFVREAYDTVKTIIPGLGTIIKGFALARFMRMFAALYRTGFTMSSALNIAGEAAGNVLLRNSARRAVVHAERGGLISDELQKSGFFPGIALNMIRSGETTGNLDELLTKSAEYFEDESKVKSRQLAVIFSVVVLLLVGILVLFAMIKFYGGYASNISSAGK